MSVVEILIFVLVPILLAITSFIFGIKFFKKYTKERKKKYLILAILLTFIIPGILILIALWSFVRSAVIDYMPDPGMA
jgi:hypothetical protein